MADETIDWFGAKQGCQIGLFAAKTKNLAFFESLWLPNFCLAFWPVFAFFSLTLIGYWCRIDILAKVWIVATPVAILINESCVLTN